jgi:hypothetical protein
MLLLRGVAGQPPRADHVVQSEVDGAASLALQLRLRHEATIVLRLRTVRWSAESDERSKRR